MQLSKAELIKALIKGLKLEDNIFSYEAVKEEIEQIQEADYMNFYKEVMSHDSYGNGLKSIIKIADTYKSKSINLFLAGTREQAKEMYNKFYSECSAMEDYAQANRDKVPNDREFFKNMPYEALKRTDGSQTYTKQELYVLACLGGGEWLMYIRCHSNSKAVIDKIENIIKTAVETKYSKQEFLHSNKKVMSAIQVKRN